jgi:hypothetical protein
MTFKIKLIGLLILVSGFANATDRMAAFKKAVDYCNCRIANAYCKEYSDKMPESVEKRSYDKIDYIFKCSTTQSLPYDSINNILKRNNFSMFSKKSSAVMSRILKEEVECLSNDEAVSKIITNIFESAEFKDLFSNYSKVHSLKEPLKKEIREYFSPSFDIIENPVDDGSNTIVPQNDSLDKIEPEEPVVIAKNITNPFIINWFTIILMIVFSIFNNFILILKIKALEKRTNRQKTDLQSIDTKKTLMELKQEFVLNVNNNDFKRSVERNISDLNSAINSLQSEFGRLLLKTQNQYNAQESNLIQKAQIEKAHKLEILYAPIPNRDGSFNSSNVTNTEDESSSFYKFTITDNLSQKATFEFLNVERAIKDATSSPELILNPVCRIKNALNQNAKRIKTVKHGTVTKQNEKWIVDKPAEIEYE